ncbi:hypothetical protein BP5796_03366 [Coleophoma crateriformis]|uniref:DUF7732 domain-containing protein n=1 Tax=Coleophoma crateriformis TaxID=565419 RepID=A0A3D8SN07_9HELO|nr:hypothetical protein BP5796_03366 [Coleophoma crateriformis]
MKFHLGVAVASLLFSTSSLALPQSIDRELVTRDHADAPIYMRAAEIYTDFDRIKDLWKRKGGGGGGGKGGGSSSGGSSSGGSSSSGSSSSGSSSSGSSSSSSGGRTGPGSSSSSTGGKTKTGSGVTPNYGGGRYYGGGATTPYSSGARSPLGIAPVFLGVGLLSIYPGLWLYGAYSYPYHNAYTFRNHSAHNTTNSTHTKRDQEFVTLVVRQDDSVNETKPVTCLCAAYAECGCDDNDNSTFLDSLIGTGDYFSLNQSLVTVADVNGTSTILINGTLPNGTTASGGTESASAAVRSFAEASGYWVMIALVGCTVLLV